MSKPRFTCCPRCGYPGKDKHGQPGGRVTGACKRRPREQYVAMATARWARARAADAVQEGQNGGEGTTEGGAKL